MASWRPRWGKVTLTDNQIFKNHDTNNDGHLCKEELKDLLKRYDTDGDGRLSKKDLHDAINGLGSRFPAWRARRALCHNDANQDGCVNEDEFDALVKYVLKRGYVLN